MKLELQSARDEFKMAESDCGSARVQVTMHLSHVPGLGNVLLSVEYVIKLCNMHVAFKTLDPTCIPAIDAHLCVFSAQLTTKIKHLSATLHKKDRQSRKGLQEMVQRRKKYLKYLRRTDWDSYCVVLSKLVLRNVPEYKPPDYKGVIVNNM
uniref:30S ribosomal protein S15, chloroplastic n=1 Tax=Oryza brachyantha TaxID=4533 RepID=J3MBR8_ORYBR